MGLLRKSPSENLEKKQTPFFHFSTLKICLPLQNGQKFFHRPVVRSEKTSLFIISKLISVQYTHCSTNYSRVRRTMMLEIINKIFGNKKLLKEV